MELRAQIGQVFQPPAEFLGDDARLQTAQTDPHLRGSFAQGHNQIGNGRFSGQIHTPGGDLNAGDDDFLVTLGCQLPGLLHRQRQRRGTDRAAGVGDDAIGAEVDAAVLDLHHRPGTLFQTACGKNFKFPASQGVVQMFLVAAVFQSGQDHGDEFLPLGAAADDVHAQGLDGFGVVLGVAAADADNSLGMLPAAAADDGAVFLVRHSGDGAGIDNVGVAGFLKRADLMAPLMQELFHGLGLILIGFAA